MKVAGYGAAKGLSGIAPDQAERDERDRALHNRIEALRTLDEPQRRRSLEEIIRDLYPYFHRWSNLICNTHSDYQREHRDDIISIAAENAFRMFSVEGMEKRSPSSWMPYLHRMMQNRSSTYYGSGAVSFVAGATMLKRRQASAAKFTKQLREMIDREPSVDEVIEYANDIIRRSRSNAERQSALLAPEDFHEMPSAVSYDSLENVISESEDQSLIHNVEGEMIVRSIVSACGELTAAHEEVAALWVGDLYGSDPRIRSSEEIAEESGHALGIVEVMLSEVREIAQRISQDRFGITFAAV